MIKRTVLIVFVPIFCSVWIYLTGSVICASEPISFEHLFRTYHDSLKHMDSFSFDYSERVMISRTGGQPSLLSTSEGMVKKSRDCLWERKNERVIKNQSVDFTENVYSPKQRLLLSKNEENLNMAKSEFAFMGNVEDMWNADKLTEEFPFPFILGYFSDVSISEYKLIPLDSFFDSTAKVSEFVDTDKKKLVEVSCAMNRSGVKVKTTARFDPEYNIALCYVGFVIEMKGFLTPITHEFVIQEFCQVGDFYYPAKFVMKSKVPPGEVVSNGKKSKQPPYEHEITVELSNFGLAEFDEDDFCITTDVPDYAPVYMQDVPQIKYVWLSGKIVPLTDELALERAKGHKFMPGPDEPRFWLMGIGIALILFACGKKTYDYFKNKK